MVDCEFFCAVIFVKMHFDFMILLENMKFLNMPNFKTQLHVLAAKLITAQFL